MDVPNLDLALARIRSRKIPARPRDGRAICDELKVPYAEGRRLFEDGFLSFDPESPSMLNEAQEAELFFLGSLVAAGCGRKLLRRMLSDLEAPYAYDTRCVYYDFGSGRWRLFPFMSDPESAFFILLERLDDAQETEVLQSIRTLIDEALDLMHDRQVFFDHLLQREGAEPPVRKEDQSGERR